MNVSAKWRVVIYWAVLIATIVLGVLTGFGLVPADAVTTGAQVVTNLVTVIAAVLALKNISPDKE
jgi:divalent metal cation (Fe/Co/Zn/Cd) transporter